MSEKSGNTEESATIETGTAPEGENVEATASSAGKETGAASEETHITPDRPPHLEEALELLDSALADVDWGYSNKEGKQRELGHRSMVLAEKAFIHAAILDREAAVKTYQNHAHRPPSDRLMKMVDNAKDIDPSKGIQDLTAGVAALGRDREQHSLQFRKNEIDKLTGDWKVALGDTHERRLQYRRRATEEMLKPEPNKNDDGLHLIRAFMKGKEAGDNLSAWLQQRKRAREYSRTIREHDQERREIVGKLEQYEVGPSGSKLGTVPTIGRNGALARRMPGVAAIVAKAVEVAAQRKNAPQTSAEPAKNNDISKVVAAVAAQRSQGAGISI